MATSAARDNRLLAHRTELPMSLGCQICPEQAVCGGLKTTAPIFDCGDLCRCTAEQKRTCPHVCPAKPQEYVRRRREVYGFGFETVGPAPLTPLPDLPAVVPWVDSRSCLAGDLRLPAAAVPLSRLFSMRTGKAIPQTPAGLARRFALSPATPVLVTGVSYEQPIEDYWGPARGAGFLDELAALRPALVSTPNFSLFSDKPREDNLYNMKRIAICWHELAARRIPTALHLNARTDCDWRRWREFLTAHPEVGSVAFEFGTGAAPKGRAHWYLRQLVALAQSVGRGLQLVVRGGRGLLGELRRHFRQVVFITPEPLMKARKRRQLVLGEGRPKWRRVEYRAGERMDWLFEENLAAFRKLIV